MSPLPLAIMNLVIASFAVHHDNYGAATFSFGCFLLLITKVNTYYNK